MSGHLYCKVSSTQPLFAREAMLPQALERRYPACIPLPPTIDPERNWMLLADGGSDLRNTPDSTLWTDARTAFARLQSTTTAPVQNWLSLGCQGRRLVGVESTLSSRQPYCKVRRVVYALAQSTTSLSAPSR